LSGFGWCYNFNKTNCQGGLENADQCAWYFPTTPYYEDYANVVVGDRGYYIQALWNLNTTTCTMTSEENNEDTNEDEDD